MPRVPRLQASSSRKIVHMHGTGGDGKYCGDNDAQFGRINVFYHEASGGKYVPRTVLFELDMIGAVRASTLGELFRPGKLVN
jgi:tubulin beta